MSNKTIPDLAHGTSPTGTERVESVQGGVSVSFNLQEIANLAPVPAGNITVSTQSGTTYTLVLGDAQTKINFTNGSAIALTIPTHASVAFPVGTTIIITQYNAGAVTVNAAGGVTLHSPGSLVKTNGLYATVSMTQDSTNVWLLGGNLA